VLHSKILHNFSVGTQGQRHLGQMKPPKYSNTSWIDLQEKWMFLQANSQNIDSKKVSDREEKLKHNEEPYLA
jgi:hypothetical protein